MKEVEILNKLVQFNWKNNIVDNELYLLRFDFKKLFFIKVSRN